MPARAADGLFDGAGCYGAGGEQCRDDAPVAWAEDVQTAAGDEAEGHEEDADGPGDDGAGYYGGLAGGAAVGVGTPYGGVVCEVDVGRVEGRYSGCGCGS